MPCCATVLTAKFTKRAERRRRQHHQQPHGADSFIEALRQLKEPCEVRLCSDSQYVINGLQKGWAKNWQRRGWKKADGSPALNPDLWAQALEQEARHKITYVWVKGHAGHPENERCDQLAVAQSKAHGGRQGT